MVFQLGFTSSLDTIPIMLVSAGCEKMQTQQAQAKSIKTTAEQKKALLSRDLKDAKAEPEKIELQQASTLAQKLLNPNRHR
jgi:hypothetical protein